MTTDTLRPANGPFVATRNACKLCTPLGACLAFAGIEGARTILHGSQGCATYIRRYMISHFKEPVDIASTNFSETRRSSADAIICGPGWPTSTASTSPR
jgi:hypothetical protein